MRNSFKLSVSILCSFGLAIAPLSRTSWANMPTELILRQPSSDEVTGPPISPQFNIDEGQSSLVPTRCPIYLAQGRIVLCERWISDTLLLQRVQYYEGCFDELIDTQTWQVISITPSYCSCPV